MPLKFGSSPVSTSFILLKDEFFAFESASKRVELVTGFDKKLSISTSAGFTSSIACALTIKIVGAFDFISPLFNIS